MLSRHVEAIPVRNTNFEVAVMQWIPTTAKCPSSRSADPDTPLTPETPPKMRIDMKLAPAKSTIAHTVLDL